MAPQNVQRLNVINKLNFRDVLCPICTTIFIEPVSLPCKHILCKQCLERTMEFNNLTCPICRARIGSFLRLSRTRGNLVNEVFWKDLKDQFPVEIEKKQTGIDEHVSEELSEDQKMPMELAVKGSIKEEFQELLEKIKTEETRCRLADEVASEKLAQRIMEEELAEEKNRKRKQKEIVKSDLLYIQNLLCSEKPKKRLRIDVPESQSSTHRDESKPSNEGRDSITAELRHFTPICIMPKTPPKRLPNGKIHETKLLRPVNMTFNADEKDSFPINQQSGLQKSSLKIYSNNFVRTKTDENNGILPSEIANNNDQTQITSESDGNVDFPPLPQDLLIIQERIQSQIEQEKQDLELAIKLQAEWNNMKYPQKQHNYMLRSAQKSKRRNTYS